MDKQNYYYFKTIDECEKTVITAAAEIDIQYSANGALYGCICRAVKTTMVCSWIAAIIYSCIMFRIGEIHIKLSYVIAPIVIFICLVIINSWAKFNYERDYILMKTNFIRNLINRCEEFHDTKYEEWQRKVIYENIFKLANMQVTWVPNENNKE